MLQVVGRRPYWQLRAVGDGRDPEVCVRLNGHIERFDSSFWNVYGPLVCKRLDCRCAIRSYSIGEIAERLGGRF